MAAAKRASRAARPAPAAPAAGRADKAALLAKRADTTTGFPEEEVEIPGFGTVLVRGLSRHEVLHLQSGPRTALALEQRTVALGLIDPPMSEDEVKQWQKVAAAGELDVLSRTIGRLSGMFDKAVKKAYADFEDDPGSEFRLLPSEGTADDGDSSAG